MNAETLARWQFATTTVYHFLIVPLSIGLTALVATMQTAGLPPARTRPAGDVWDRSARFWGRIMLVIFALGVVTGIVQEFQFGMNWSTYSRFVGDIFGAPLAMEGLIAFFLESTFLGLWIFGRDILSPRLHLAMHLARRRRARPSAPTSSWPRTASCSTRSAWSTTRRADRVELTSIWKVLFNSTQLVTFPHTVLAAFMTAAALLLSVSAWHLRRDGSHGRSRAPQGRRPGARRADRRP